MDRPILIDSGVLVALLSRSDNYHQSSVKAVSSLPKPFLTCEPVVTEACFYSAVIAKVLKVSFPC
jgi:uncharacterized protein